MHHRIGPDSYRNLSRVDGVELYHYDRRACLVSGEQLLVHGF